ncbi:glycosyl hydrolase family 61-domain-containing protein [Aspergillus pseudotamarii]|uniref:lytic cellulose monooxygenase (C4-dehydrogenating) n=1 Tax=Aspergillus pseudotamarii TaxID=132259 RepID=A0A5N6S7W0_ASPPS|nr:glycosyl hydrolase family 61-domain-containing protein [Aspergillus pseudotamarii]KAE8130702.1 glycosyl hydrolase family 61-domain-containing protein [Aspergillus pseudotamarii]
MKATLALLIAVLGVSHTGLGHYVWSALILDGERTADYKYVRKDQRPPGDENVPVTDIESSDIRCNYGGTSTGTSVDIANVTAGSTVWEHENIYHPGPIMVYMSKADGNVKSYDGSRDWFKIAELGGEPECPEANVAGLTSQFLFDPYLRITKRHSHAIKWPALGKTEFHFTIPSKTPSGQYLLRIEQVGLHRAQEIRGAEFFISCAHINVIEGGSGHPMPMVEFAGAYDWTDPGLLVNIYDTSCYALPGPPVWEGNKASID